MREHINIVKGLHNTKSTLDEKRARRSKRKTRRKQKTASLVYPYVGAWYGYNDDTGFDGGDVSEDIDASVMGVIDEDRNPMPVFYGSDDSDINGWFCNDRQFAVECGSNVSSHYIKMAKPYVIENPGLQHPMLTGEDPVPMLQNQGYDGIIVAGNGLINYYVFDSSQIINI